MARFTFEYKKITTASLRYFISLIVLQIFLISHPTYAETLTEPNIEPAPAISEAKKAEPTPVLITQIAHPHRITAEYVKGYFNDTGRILASPTDWDRNDWLKAGLVIGATSGLLLADADIKNFAQKNQSSAGDIFASVGNALGNPLFTVPPLALLYIYCHINDDAKARRTSLLAIESLAISGAFTWSLKIAAQRPRPNTGESPTTWNGPSLKSFNTSFPSGHTTAAFSVASVLAEEYGNNAYVPTIVYGLASLTGLARMYDNKHWASDVFTGAAIGYFVGKAVVKYHTVQGNTSVKILPTLSQQGFGLVAEYRF